MNEKQKPRKTKDASAPLRDYARYSGIGIQMVVVITTFAYGGKWLDAYWQTGQPWMTIIGSLTGVGMSLYLIIRALKE